MVGCEDRAQCSDVPIRLSVTMETLSITPAYGFASADFIYKELGQKEMGDEDTDLWDTALLPPRYGGWQSRASTGRAIPC
jgi:hypothetical protein